MAVPLALHVDYWDYIGWKDAFAQPAFAGRQSWLVRVNHRSTSFTPHFFVSGREVQDWRSDLVAEAGRASHLPAGAVIHLRATGSSTGMLDLEVSASSVAGADPLGIFVAVTEDGLVSQVRAGENGGATLHHDHVVREWIGPLALSAGKVTARRTITLNPRWNRAQIGVAAFVQNLSNGEVLQAVSTGHCL